MRDIAVLQGARKVCLIASMLSVSIAAPFAAAAKDVPSSLYPSHFILLIDDSGDMPRHRDRIVTEVPAILFGERPLPAAAAVKPPPKFDPNRDLLWVAAYGITEAGKRDPKCRHDPPNPNSFLPDHLFRWISVSSPTSSAVLSHELSREFGEGGRGRRSDCRFRHDNSPISTASTLALATGVTHLNNEKARHSRVFLVNVTNLVSNTNPSGEIAQFARTQGTANAAEALDLARKVQTNFYLESPPEWLLSFSEVGDLTTGFSDPSERLRVVFSEARPVESNPSGLVDVVGHLVLDRVATSRERVEVVTADRRPAELIVRGDSRFVIENLKVNGRPVETCHKGCRLSMLDLLGLAPDSSARLVDLGNPQPVRVAAEFRYDTPVYRSLFFPIKDRQIDVVVKPPLTVGPETVIPWVSLPLLDDRWSDWFREIRLDDSELAALWRDGDGQLTQEQAVQRILDERRKIRERGLAFGGPLGILALLFTGSGAWSLYARRRFRPQLTWRSAGTVSIGFDAPGDAPILLGTIEVWNAAPRNPGGHTEEPHRDAIVRIGSWNLAELGLDLDDGAGPTIGFVHVECVDRLAPEIGQIISHGTAIALFLNPAAIRDLTVPAISGPVDLPVTGSVGVEWPRMRSDRVPRTGLLLDVELTLRIEPESPREPCVEFDPVPAPPEFRGHRPGERPFTAQIGTFRFISRAHHRFALPFREHFAVRVERAEGPLPDGTGMLDRPDVIVPALATQTRQGLLVCDGTRVPNPAGVNESYRFMLAGRCEPGSAVGPHHVRLRRDGTRCEAMLIVQDGQRRLDIAWDRETGRPLWRYRAESGGDPPFRALDGGTLELPGQSIRFDDRTGAQSLVVLEIGNTGTVGKGTVDAVLHCRIAGDPVVVGGLGGDDPDSLLVPYDGGRPASARLRIGEGEAALSRTIALDTRQIGGIDGGVLEMGMVSAVVTVTLNVVADDGTATSQSVTIATPLRLELLPSPNWLCIDFGTSAISVAHGRGDEVEVLPLQHIRQGTGDASASNPCLADFERGNIERNSRSLLPSFVLCDADRRRTPVPDRQLRPGFPRFGPASMKPGDPSFISLPAPMESLRNAPGRVIYSLKSWVGLSARHVSLKEKVPFLVGGRETARYDLPLDELLQSGFAALAEAYILPAEVRPGQIVITHPNTFTPLHQGRLHRNAFAALAKRFNIPRKERIRLLSESDAVAYHYCQQRRSHGDRPTGREHIMVYDLGAGTLDLSVIVIDWADGRVAFPQRWRTIHRLGVPVAGNHLDGILARLVDKCLRDIVAADPTLFDYRYPLVGKAPARSREAEHAEASHSLWLAIREAKQGGEGGAGWNGVAPLKIAVAAPTMPEPWPLMLSQEASKAGNTVREILSRPIPDDGVGLSYRVGSGENGSDRIELSLPAPMVHGFPPLTDYLAFITGDVIREALVGSGLTADQIDTVLISGRGTLWPGLGDAVRGHFPETTNIPDLNDAEAGLAMKEAVVRGAIAWQGMTAPTESPPPPRLAVLLEPHKEAIDLEAGRTVAIELGDNQYFRLVQIAHSKPRPAEDLRTLRRHFYIDLAAPEYRVDAYWAEDRTLLVTVDTTDDGALVVRLGNPTRPILFELRADGESAGDAVRPPWPIGDIILPPIKESVR